jgi:hypothetical protein
MARHQLNIRMRRRTLTASYIERRVPLMRERSEMLLEDLETRSRRRFRSRFLRASQKRSRTPRKSSRHREGWHTRQNRR